jgi:hypothetical protein
LGRALGFFTARPKNPCLTVSVETVREKPDGFNLNRQAKFFC